MLHSNRKFQYKQQDTVNRIIRILSTIFEEDKIIFEYVNKYIQFLDKTALENSQNKFTR